LITLKEYYKNNISTLKGISNTSTYKPIIQYSLDGKFIKEWCSTKSVCEELGFNNSSISSNLIGRSKTSNGFIWKYKNKI